MKVLIEGAGIAGIALAGFLQKGGAEVTIVEQADNYRNDGYGIFLWPLGKRVLGNFNLLEEIEKKSTPITHNTIVDHDEKYVYKFDFTPLEKRYGNVIGIARRDLYDTFLKAIGKLNTKFKTTIDKISYTDKGVRVTFNNGKEEDFDVVVGADGVRSPIRQHIFSDAKIKYYGKSMWIAWVEGLDLSSSYCTSILGKGGGALIFPGGKGKHVVYLMAPAPKKFVHEEESERLANIQEAFKNFTGTVQKVIQNLKDPKDILHASMTKVLSDTWYHKRVVLIGDAEHAMSPISGIGTSLALEDAQVLSQELLAVEPKEVPLALQRFSKRRKKRIRQASVLSNGLMFFITPTSATVCRVRNFGVKHMLPQRFFINQAIRMHDDII